MRGIAYGPLCPLVALLEEGVSRNGHLLAIAVSDGVWPLLRGAGDGTFGIVWARHGASFVSMMGGFVSHRESNLVDGGLDVKGG